MNMWAFIFELSMRILINETHTKKRMSSQDFSTDFSVCMFMFIVYMKKQRKMRAFIIDSIISIHMNIL